MIWDTTEKGIRMLSLEVLVRGYRVCRASYNAKPLRPEPEERWGNLKFHPISTWDQYANKYFHTNPAYTRFEPQEMWQEMRWALLYRMFGLVFTDRSFFLTYD